MMMRSSAQEVASQEIWVNAIVPVAIKTEINRQGRATPQAEADLLKLISYARIGEPEDIAQATIGLAPEGADHVTGTTLYVDSETTLSPGFLGNG